MGHYQVGKFLFEVVRKPELASQFREDPEAVLGRYQLGDEERQAILAGDMDYINALGVHPLLVAMSRMSLGMRPPVSQAEDSN